MITTGSKFFSALAVLFLVTAVVYGYSSGGDALGPLTGGLQGAVGDHLGYGILLAAAALAAFLGSTSIAFRDADPGAGAGAAQLGTEVPDQVAVPGASYWPVVGAFGAGLVVVGVVLNNVFFVAGLIVLGATTIEWTIQAWADRATGDPAVNREIRNRMMLPLEVPIAGALAIALVVVGYSRVFLAASQAAAVWVALAVAATIFVVGTILSTRDRLRSDLVAGLLAVAAVVTIGLGIFGAVAGERDFEHHDEEHTSDEDTDGEHTDEGGAPSGEEGAVVLEESN